MNIEFSKNDLMLIEMLLSKEEGMTRVEIHHCFSHDYKNFLKEREKQIGDLLTRIRNALAVINQ
jgi:hypothetical protein